MAEARHGFGSVLPGRLAALLAAQRIGEEPPAALRPWLRLPLLRAAYDRATLRRWHAEFHGCPATAAPPQRFSDRMLHRLLHERDPLFRRMNDKLAMRDLAAERLGGRDTLVPVLGAWDRIEDIPWEALPQQVVLKAAHGSGMVLHTMDRSALDREATLATLRGWLGRDYYETQREWGYRGIPRRILAEPAVRDETGSNPAEYKFQCFGGRARVVRIVTGGFGREVKETHFDPTGRAFLPFTAVRRMDPSITLAADVARGTAIAEALAAGFAQLRIDLYRLGAGRWMLGEMTPYDSAGRVGFAPPAWDAWLGALWGEALGEGPAPERPDRVAAARVGWA